MKIIAALSLLFILGQSSLEPSQSPKKTLVQTTARTLMAIPKSFRKTQHAKIASETIRRFNEQQTFIQALTDLTELPKELIGLIALYNQTIFSIGNVGGSAPCSLEGISPEVVAVGCEDGSIYLVDSVEGRILQKLSSHKTPVYALCFSPEYGQLASLSTLGGCVPTNLSFESVQQEKNTSQIKVHVQASGQEAKWRDETLRIWHLSLEPTFGPQSYSEPALRCHLTTVVAADQACKNEEEIERIFGTVATLRAQGLRAGITQQRLWTSTRYCAEVASKPTIAQEKDVLWFWYNERAMVLPKGGATSCWFSTPEDFLGWSSGEIVVIDNQNCKVKDSLKGHAAAVRLLRPFMTPAGLQCLASGSDDGTIRIWDVKAKKCLQTLIGHTAPIRAIKTSFEGYLLSCSDDGTIRKWALEF